MLSYLSPSAAGPTEPYPVPLPYPSPFSFLNHRPFAHFSPSHSFLPPPPPRSTIINLPPSPRSRPCPASIGFYITYTGIVPCQHRCIIYPTRGLNCTGLINCVEKKTPRPGSKQSRRTQNKRESSTRRQQHKNYTWIKDSKQAHKQQLHNRGYA